MAFHKKRGLKLDEMAKSAWGYRKLRNFQQASKPVFPALSGLTDSWKGLAHFKAYVWSSVVHNLALFSRLVPT